MSVRVRSQLIVVAALDSDEKKVQFGREEKTTTQVIDTFDVESSSEIVLAASEADYTLPMGKVVAGKLLYIESDVEITVKLDGSSDPQSIGAPTSGSLARLYLRGDFTAAPVVSNPGTTPATVAYLIAGSKA